jgi:hypothetical protein
MEWFTFTLLHVRNRNIIATFVPEVSVGWVWEEPLMCDESLRFMTFVAS